MNRESERKIAIVCASDTAVSIVLEILKNMAIMENMALGFYNFCFFYFIEFHLFINKIIFSY